MIFTPCPRAMGNTAGANKLFEIIDQSIDSLAANYPYYRLPLFWRFVGFWRAMPPNLERIPAHINHYHSFLIFFGYFSKRAPFLTVPVVLV